jgi:hypothetical protein
MDDRNKHQSVCLYGSKKCPTSVLTGVDRCWTGNIANIEAHIVAKHDLYIFAVQNHFGMSLLNLARGKSYHCAVFTMGELFSVTLEAEGDVFSFGVFHYGPKEESEAFKYGIKIGGFEEYISLTRKCHSCLEGDPMESQPEKYVKIYYNTILDFVDESGHLMCEFEIGREKLSGFVLEEQRKFLYTISVIGHDGHFWVTENYGHINEEGQWIFG